MEEVKTKISRNSLNWPIFCCDKFKVGFSMFWASFFSFWLGNSLTFGEVARLAAAFTN